MLIFRRKVGEKIVVGKNEVNIKILGVERNAVLIGFEASDDIEINRSEIYLRKQKSGNVSNSSQITRH